MPPHSHDVKLFVSGATIIISLPLIGIRLPPFTPQIPIGNVETLRMQKNASTLDRLR
jgi:hypothetical protein